jgi:hypothetical protein
MRALCSVILFLPVVFSCSEEGAAPVTNSDLLGFWQLSEQQIGATQYNEYIQIHTAVDINTNAVLWSDTIYFGSTSFVFQPCGDPCIIKRVDISSQHVRPLKGSWVLESGNAELTIQALATPQMNEDTVINGHTYAYFDLVNDLSFTVASVQDDQLELRTGNQVLRFNRNK